MARLPHVVVPISHNNIFVGSVDINWNGSFSGEIKIKELHENIVAMLKTGTIRSIGIHFEIERTTPIPKPYVDAMTALRETLKDSGYCDNDEEASDLITQLLDAGVRFVNEDEMKRLI